MHSVRPNSQLLHGKFKLHKNPTAHNDESNAAATPPALRSTAKATVKNAPKSAGKTVLSVDMQEATADDAAADEDAEPITADHNDQGDQGQSSSTEISMVDVIEASLGGAPVGTSCVCGDATAVSAATGKINTLVEMKRYIPSNRINQLRRIALEAAKQHKTFTIRGCFYSIRRGLMARGWVEKFDVHRRQSGSVLCQPTTNDIAEIVLPNCKPGTTRRAHISKCERNIVSRFLDNKPIDFLWCARKERSDFTDMVRNPGMTVSRLNRNPFTSKSGMCSVLRDFHWFFDEGTSELYYPRSYNVFLADDMADFVDDFRMSACLAMLRYVIEIPQANEFGDDAADTTNNWKEPLVPITAVQFAIEQCRRYVHSAKHFDIDEPPTGGARVADDHEWNVFLDHHHALTGARGWLARTEHTPFVVGQAAETLAEVEPYWQQHSLDGLHNIWIVKPSNRCRGRGIRLMNELRKIVEFVNPAATVNKGHWVVQKYIERPLIIHNCKFDIRQWFLVTSVHPLTIWMYRECYLRFSSQEFSLVNLHESVHLTNHAVQKRYRNDDLRDQRLPKDNMWDCYTFQAYLRQIGETDQWANRIYPGMRRALIGTMLASQDLMDRRANTFELFGADFMVTADFQPWLIEINSSPDLAASTSVTARMCPQCLDDLVKVVIDYRNNPKAPTGEFELIYKQSVPPAPSYLGLDLYLVGTQLHKSNKIGRSTSISPRNTTTNNISIPRRPPSRPRRTPMPMIKTPRIESTENPTTAAPSTARTTSPPRRVKRPSFKQPITKHHDHPKTELELLLDNFTPRTPRSTPSVTQTQSARNNRSTNRLLSSSLMTPTAHVLRDIQNRERVAELRRRHHALCAGGGAASSRAAAGPAEATAFVKNVLNELTDFRCVGNRLVSRDMSLAIRRVPPADTDVMLNDQRTILDSALLRPERVASPKRLRKEEALANAAGRLLRRRSRASKLDGKAGDTVAEFGKSRVIGARQATRLNAV